MGKFQFTLIWEKVDVTPVCCYLIKKENYDTNKALEIIKKHRDIADPNYAFESQLNEFYLKEVIGLIKVPKKYKNRGYSCYNNLKKFSPVKKFKLSNLEDNKSKVKKIRSKKVNVVQNMMENSKVLLYNVMDKLYIENRNLNEGEIRKLLEKMVKEPALTYRKLFDKVNNKTTEKYKLRKKRLTNLISREGLKFVDEILSKNKK